ncbi:carbohydrate kinase family protein [Natronomonas amylolytica]|uniref:carbohydrate kinase family protein n=1 Tax=Natronomonas amylolytica TaxID=3108498 RepID=UPI00300AC851
MRVVCAGHVNWDVRLRVDRLPAPDDEARIHERSASGGGSAANVAVDLSRLDVETRLFGSVGDDGPGRRAVAELREAGVDPLVTVVEDAETTTKYILIDADGEVALLGTDGANEAIDPGDISPALLEGADCVHLTGQRPDTAHRIASLAAERDVLVSFDPGRRLADRDFTDALTLTDLVFVNDREAELLEVSVPRQLTKHGAAGATYAGPDGEFSHAGFDVESVVDTTGAGDAFAAGFLSSWLSDRDPEQALAVANACGALAAATYGPRPNLPADPVAEVR